MSVARDVLSKLRQKFIAWRGGRAPVDEPATPTLFEADAYLGYDAADIDRLTILSAPIAPPPREGFVTNFIGTSTRLHMLPGTERFDGQTIAELPIPGDSLHAETIEYSALALALSQRRNDQFQMIELGAGWAPWMAAAGVVARRLGVADIRLLGIEADPTHFEFCKQHLADNGLRPDTDEPHTTFDGVDCVLMMGAVWWEDTELFFPDEPSPMDYGLAAQQGDSASDYRGARLAQRRVQAFGLHRLIEERGVIDFIHFDIQGGEWEVITRSLDALTGSVRFMCIGTHSRKIEGDLLELLTTHGWSLHNEKPCRFVHDPAVPTLAGMTTADGVQVWRNSRIA